MYRISFLLLFLSYGVIHAYIPPPQLHDVTVETRMMKRRLLKDNELATLALWMALSNNDVEAMKKALDDGAEANDKTEPSEYRPIHLAASVGNLEAVSVLIENGADVDVQTTNGTTPLHYAANRGDIRMTKALLSKDADPDLADNRLFTPLHYACYAPPLKTTKPLPFKSGGYFEMAKESEADISVVTTAMSQGTVIGLGNYRAVVDVLLSHGADVDAETESDETPLYYTPAFDQYLIAKKLVEAGADVDHRDVEQETPLHEAVAYGAIGVTQILLLNGAKMDLKEENGLTPEEFICRCKTYKTDQSLTQCAEGKCVNEYDDLVLKKLFQVAAEGN